MSTEVNQRFKLCLCEKLNRRHMVVIFLIQIILIGIYYQNVSNFKPSLTLQTSKDTLASVLENKKLHSIISKLEDKIASFSSSSKNISESDSSENTTVKIETTIKTLINCSAYPSNLLGRVKINFSIPIPEYKNIEDHNKLIHDGGQYTPPDCLPKWKVAIILPYRNRENHLRFFLHFMHPTLQRQEIHYRIYLINQAGGEKFNRAKLLNVGFKEALKDEKFDCFLFHDVDHILINDKALYTCPESPRHMSHVVDKYNWGLPYEGMFGGVSQLTREQFELANGFANTYWGWGAEDDDLRARIIYKGMKVIRYPKDVAIYMMIPHQRDVGNEVNPIKDAKLRETKDTMDRDGLSTLNYTVLYREPHKLYTNITVDIGLCGDECTNPRSV